MHLICHATAVLVSLYTTNDILSKEECQPGGTLVGNSLGLGFEDLGLRK